MTQPHHHVFNVLEQEISRGVAIEPLLPLLLQKGVIQQSNKTMFESRKNGMRILVGYLRSKDYDTFVRFVECIYEAQQSLEGSSKIYLPIVKSIKQIVTDFDSRHNTQHVLKINEIIDINEKVASLVKEVDIVSLDETGSATQQSHDGHGDLPFPNLSYLEEPKTFTFTPDTCTYFNQKYDVMIETEPDAFEVENHLTLKIGLCSHGPFAIPDTYKVVTGFLCIVADNELVKPFRITLQHCLVMSVYEQCDSVLILHADHKVVNSSSENFIFEPLYEDVDESRYDYSKGRKSQVHPLISPDSPHLSFRVSKFCILCGVVKTERPQDKKPTQSDVPVQQMPTSSCFTSHLEAEDSSSYDTPSLSGGEEVQQRTSSTSSSASAPGAKEALHDTQAQQDIKNFQEAHDSPRRPKLKRQRSVVIDSTVPLSKHTCCEYAIIMMEPIDKIPPFSFQIFVCQNCYISVEECLQQSTSLCIYKQFTPQMLIGIFQLKEIHFSVTIKGRGWTVVAKKTPSVVKEQDIHINQTAALCFSKHRLYPPRLDFEVSLDPYCSDSTQLTCTIEITGFQCSDLTRNELVSFAITAEPIQLTSPSLRYQRTSSLINQYSSLTYQQKQTIIDDRALLELSKLIIDWKSVGQHLELEEALLYNICVRDPSPGKYEHAYQVLWEWKRHKESPTCADIAKALIEANEMEALDFLIRYISNCS